MGIIDYLFFDFSFAYLTLESFSNGRKSVQIWFSYFVGMDIVDQD